MKGYKVLILFLINVIKSHSQLNDGYFLNNNNPNENEVNIVADNGFLGNTAQANYSVWYGCGGNGILHNDIVKPFIWVEGIDLDPTNNEYVSNVPADNAFAQDLYIELARRGFDIVQVDFATNPTYIQRNAEVIISLIEDINARMQDPNNGSTQEIVIMGTSMGAVIVRYALTLMENRGINHNVRLFISHDGPNQGSNIPWGLQYMAQDLTLLQVTTLFAAQNLVTELFQDFLDDNNISTTYAAFQLLRTSPIPIAQALRATFEANLLAIGDYPDNCRIVAISNGANNIPYQPLGYQYLDVNAAGTGQADMLQLFPGAIIGVYAGYEFDVEIYGSNGIGSLVYDRYAEAFAGVNAFGVPLGVNIVSQNSFLTCCYGGILNWDGAPGGIWGETLPLLNMENFTFIPTVSALDINTNDPFFMVNNINGFGTTQIPYNLQFGVFQNYALANTAYTHSNNISPFDAIWADNTNTWHSTLEIGGDGIEFLLQEIAPDVLVVQDRIITGNVTFDAQEAVILGGYSPAFPAGPVIINGGAAYFQGGQLIDMTQEVEILNSEVIFQIAEYDCIP